MVFNDIKAHFKEAPVWSGLFVLGVLINIISGCLMIVTEGDAWGILMGTEYGKFWWFGMTLVVVFGMVLKTVDSRVH